MSDQSAADLRRTHAAAVLANQVRPADRWGQPYLAYSACVRPGGAAAAALTAVQDGIAGLEPALLRVPEPAMHANVAWLLPGHRDFGRPKDEIWRARGAEWMAALADVAGAAGGFRLRFSRLVATDAAVIAVAEEPNGVSELRAALAPLLDVPGELAAGGLVHLTLFRYPAGQRRPGALRRPAALLRQLDGFALAVDVAVGEILVVRETVFPSLEYEVLRRLALRAR